MEPKCPECESDAAVTTTNLTDGRASHTCHFSHGGKGSVTWVEAKPAPRAAALRTSRPAVTTRAPRVAKAPSAPVDITQRAIDAFRAEVARRGGQATVRRAGNRNEVVVKPAGVAMEFQVLVRARTGGDFQSSTTFGKVRAPQEFPTRFWVFVDLFPSTTNFYVVPEWWIQNDIMEQSTAPGQAEDESAASADPTHHAISTERVAQWEGKWRQLGL